jgi:hypothetical protein
VGRPDAGEVARLQLRRGPARFDARFRLPDLLAWSGAAQAGSPIPPLDGEFTARRLEISGGRLEGVEVQIEDPDIDDSHIDGPGLDGRNIQQPRTGAPP